MELSEILSTIGNSGGTVILAALFVWVFITDKKRMQETLETNTELLKVLSQNNQNNSEILKTLALSNDNIARSLEIIQKNMEVTDGKIDRNYEAILKREEKDYGRNSNKD